MFHYIMCTQSNRFIKKYQLLCGIRIHVHLCVESTASYFTHFYALNNKLHKYDTHDKNDRHVSCAGLDISQMLLTKIYFVWVWFCSNYW